MKQWDKLLWLAAALVASAVVGSAIVGCQDAEDDNKFIGGDGTDNPIGSDQNGIGEECGKSTECRPGLTCGSSGTCEPAGTQGIGQSCFVGPECQDGFFCGAARACFIGDSLQPGSVCSTDQDCADFGKDAECSNDISKVNQECQPAGEGELNEVCTLDGDCKAGLRCAYTAGFSGTCAATGTVDYGGACTGSGDCYAGLVCGGSGTCVSWLEALRDAAVWEGVSCDADDTTNPRVYFELPRADGMPQTEFYRLPYPNDIRLAMGHAATGHPTPGAPPLDFDVVQRLVDAADEALEGFGTTPTVTFRFSAPVEFGSVTYDGEDPNLRFVNIDPDSPGFGLGQGYGWQASSGRGKYVCQNYMTVHNGFSGPLDPDTTYAVVLLEGIRTTSDAGAQLLRADGDLQTVLADSSPGGAAGTAWEAYAPLRAWLASEGIPTSKVVGAAVFTTAPIGDMLPKAREAVRDLPMPELLDVTLCGDGVESPCAVEGDSARACSNTSEFHEIQGKIRLPAFQQGDPPFLEPGSGGGFTLGAGGVPIVTGYDDVCFSLTIPKGASMPAEGWPVVLYAHGTGGHFRSHVLGGVATSVATSSAPAAVLGIDAVMHGPRRGDTELEADVLFFNFANPIAARGNVNQSAIDYFGLTRWVSEFAGDLASFPGLTFDAAKIAYYGHSQGSTTGPLVLANEPLISAAVLSGAGSGLVASLMGKIKPVNIPAGLDAVLREDASETQPVMSLLQTFFDPVDSVNFAKYITREPPEGQDPKHMLLIYGKDDSYTPPRTTRILADILEIALVGAGLSTGTDEAFAGYPEDRHVQGPLPQDPPLRPVTYGMVHYAPDGDYDGHFVNTRNPNARLQVIEFLQSFFGTGTPVINTPNNQ